ncbi:TOMM precursor leader peptide-binding protein [Streptomyces sp. SKN60]|uniref:TOMM precursor leader peptide-binding protein n=1 Tax=Streptomyces sp. SKN60 TaxID=2855506 RepID=UPI0022461E9D|nr:TOMM precursor leader peptide-binding protein [Streptomyces sp. SKN60]
MTEAQSPARGPFVAFKRHVRAVSVPGEAVFVWSDQDMTAVRGAGAETLLGLLDGRHTLSEVLAEAAATMPADVAGGVMRQLAEANLVGYRHGGPGPSVSAERSAAEAYWDRAGLDGAAADRAVRGRLVSVIGVGAVDEAAARAACRASGLTPVGADADADFALVLCEDYLMPGLRETAERLRAARRPWLLASPFAAEPWTGPVFEPDGGSGGGFDGGSGSGSDDGASGASEGACWSCLTHRLREHHRGELSVRQALGLDRPGMRPASSLPAVRAVGLHSAVLEAAKWLAGLRTAEQRAVCVLDGLTLRTTHHPVRRRPQCPACGDPALVADRARRPVVPVSRPKAEGSGSNDRALSAEQLLDRYGHLIGPVTGIVPEIRPMAGLPEGLHAYDSGHNLALRGHSPASLRKVLRARSSGKGTTAAEARASALGEAVERYCGTRQGDEATITDTLAGLGASAVHPHTYQLFHERQYADRDRWNAAHTPFHQVCAPFDPHRPTQWTPVWSLTAGVQRFLPTSTLYFDCTPGGAPDGQWADSNGNAAGSSTEDALVQGFLELAERDAVSLWWYNRLRRPGIDLDAFDEPWLARLRAALGRAGRQVWALDLTSDLGIPVMVAVSRRAGAEPPDLVYGFGAHFDPRLALRRALTEMVQTLPPAAAAAAPRSPERPYLLPDPGQSARTPAAWPAYARTPDLLDDVETVRALVAAHGLEWLVLDQTRPDVGIPVVKTLVPGLRHFYARFAPGRLYDVPVRLGERVRPTPYEELNSEPLAL